MNRIPILVLIFVLCASSYARLVMPLTRELHVNTRYVDRPSFPSIPLSQPLIPNNPSSNIDTNRPSESGTVIGNTIGSEGGRESLDDIYGTPPIANVPAPNRVGSDSLLHEPKENLEHLYFSFDPEGDCLSDECFDFGKVTCTGGDACEPFSAHVSYFHCTYESNTRTRFENLKLWRCHISLRRGGDYHYCFKRPMIECETQDLKSSKSCVMEVEAWTCSDVESQKNLGEMTFAVSSYVNRKYPRKSNNALKIGLYIASITFVFIAVVVMMCVIVSTFLSLVDIFRRCRSHSKPETMPILGATSNVRYEEIQ